MHEWELDHGKHYEATDDEIRQLRRDAQEVHNFPLASLCSKALTGDEEARDRVARILKGQ